MALAGNFETVWRRLILIEQWLLLEILKQSREG
jgi:hypothetical protein